MYGRDLNVLVQSLRYDMCLLQYILYRISLLILIAITNIMLNKNSDSDSM